MGEEGSSIGGQRKDGLGSQKCDRGRCKSQIAVVRTSELIAPDENDTERPRLMRKMRQKG